MPAESVVSPLASQDEAAVLALNNLHAAELSFLDAERLPFLIGEAFYAGRIGRLDAFLLAFDQTAAYDSPNFLWFRRRYERFAYVDRVVVASHARGRGHARLLYEELFARAAAAGHDIVACEVNSEPPNPASDAFHGRMGFSEVGSATSRRASGPCVTTCGASEPYRTACPVANAGVVSGTPLCLSVAIPDACSRHDFSD